MARPECLESSLRRSAKLGLEVLERASRRSVDWTCGSKSSWTPSEDTNEGDSTHTTLDDAFETIAEFMAQTTHQCKNVYSSAPAPTNNERTHFCRYHSHQRPGTSTALQTRKYARSAPEDFHIELSPGTYAITAGAPDSQKQTRLVHINAGESINLTFNL